MRTSVKVGWHSAVNDATAFLCMETLITASISFLIIGLSYLHLQDLVLVHDMYLEILLL